MTDLDKLVAEKKQECKPSPICKYKDCDSACTAAREAQP